MQEKAHCLQSPSKYAHWLWTHGPSLSALPEGDLGVFFLSVYTVWPKIQWKRQPSSFSGKGGFIIRYSASSPTLVTEPAAWDFWLTTKAKMTIKGRCFRLSQDSKAARMAQRTLRKRKLPVCVLQKRFRKWQEWVWAEAGECFEADWGRYDGCRISFLKHTPYISITLHRVEAQPDLFVQRKDGS